MDKSMLERVRAVCQNTPAHKDKTERAVVTALKKYLASRKYRADLKLVAEDSRPRGKFSVSIRYSNQLGCPHEKDLMGLIAQHYPTYEIDWDLANVDQDNNVVMLVLTPSVESIPVESLEKIPPEFKPIGTCIYKRAADNSGTVFEIWNLKKGDDGLVLYRNHNDLEVKAEEESLKAGDVVNTPYGPGRISRFDDNGNAFVQVAGTGKLRLVAAPELKPYDIDSERKKLEQYYAEAYGDPEFGRALTRDIEKELGQKKQ